MQLGESGCTSVQLFETISSPFSFLRSHDRSRPTVRRQKIFAARSGRIDHRPLASADDQECQAILRRARISEVEYRGKGGEESLVCARAADRSHFGRKAS